MKCCRIADHSEFQNSHHTNNHLILTSVFMIFFEFSARGRIQSKDETSGCRRHCGIRSCRRSSCFRSSSWYLPTVGAHRILYQLRYAEELLDYQEFPRSRIPRGMYICHVFLLICMSGFRTGCVGWFEVSSLTCMFHITQTNGFSSHSIRIQCNAHTIPNRTAPGTHNRSQLPTTTLCNTSIANHLHHPPHGVTIRCDRGCTLVLHPLFQFQRPTHSLSEGEAVSNAVFYCCVFCHSDGTLRITFLFMLECFCIMCSSFFLCTCMCAFPCHVPPASYRSNSSYNLKLPREHSR